MYTRNSVQFWQDPLPPWDCDQNNTLVCCQVRQETPDVKSFFFRPTKPGLFNFLPGQFLTLELPIDGATVHRSYTISSSPTHPHTISITVKRKVGGVVSNWLHENLKFGSRLSVLAPAGEFTCAHHPANKYLFLSGGSGITPLMSMSRAFHELAEDRDIMFVHSARSPDDIIFRKELELMAFNQPHFRTAFICEKVGAVQQENIISGFLDFNTLQLTAPDFLEREVFTCGPEPYMAAVRAMLEKAGFDMQHYHEESFNFADLGLSEALPETNTNASSGESFSIELTSSKATIQCAPNQFVLNAAHAAGFRLPSACSKGLCGTCKSKLISGKVDMKHGGGIRPREIEQGLFLPCCSKPLSNLVIER